MPGRDRCLLIRSSYHAVARTIGARVPWHVAWLAVVLAARPISAQSLPIQSVLGVSTVSGCSATPGSAPAAPLPASTATLRDLVERGQDAALQGDHAAALEAYKLAAAIAPSDPKIVYYLGREHEALRDARAAVTSYCHYLALAPSAADADEVRGRVVRLTPVQEISRLDDAQALFRSGVVLLEHGEFRAADSLMTATTALVPEAPAALYNRALARGARGDRSRAEADFRRYIALTPGGSDHAAIATALEALPRRVHDPGNAFTVGLLFPGLGQFRTRRPLQGAAVLGAIGGALVLALQWDQEYQLVARRDAQGRPFADSVYATVHPTAVVGYSAAAAIWIGAALESMWYARRTRARSAALIARDPEGSARLVVRPFVRPRRVGSAAGGSGIEVGLSWR
jgi:tetratricopeptide (TPR) repeat protein